MIRTRRMLGAGAVACAGLLSITAAGHAATATVTNDAGVATALEPGAVPTIRNMSPQLVTSFAASEAFYSINYTFTPVGGAAGPVDAFSDSACRSVNSQRSTSNDLPYLGNGTYAVTVKTSTDAKDFDCAKLGAAKTFSFTVAASTALATPPPFFLLRNQNSLDINEYAVPVDINPGASSAEIQIGKGAVGFNPDGSLTTPLTNTLAVPADPVLRRKIFEAGDYTFVARSTRGTSGTAWSTPIKTRFVEPFDLVTAPYFTDSRGPTYKVSGRVRAARPSGKVTMYGKRRGAKKFRKLGTGRIRSTRNFGIRFKLRKTGRYQLQFRFKGSPFVVGGAVTYKGYRFRTRRVFS